MSTPTIVGTSQVGQTLTASIGDIKPPVTYQWKRAGTPIPGATNPTYVVLAADIGNAITVAVVAVSQPTSAVIDIIPANLTLPTIAGTAQQGATLTATLGTWSHNPTSYAQEWANTKGLIPGATALTYVPTSADVGLILEFFVVAINSGGTSAVVHSAPTAAVLPAVPVNTARPTISGTAQVGQTLTATTGTWTNNPTSYAYQWNLSGSPINGATVATYVLIEADVGHILTVSVVAKNSAGSSTPATSAATSSVIDIIPTNITLPTISGTAKQGATLTATVGTWSHNPTSFAKQWANTSIGPIPGATALTYVPTASDVGFEIAVFVSATNSGGTSAAVESALTSIVLPVSGGPILKNSLAMTIGAIPLPV
jgi:hypothetical protein